jgi:hypothetical protein
MSQKPKGMMMRYPIFLIVLMAGEGACETRIPATAIGSGSPVAVDTDPQTPLINVGVDISEHSARSAMRSRPR